ncbi:putative mucin TcMUCII [Trypanosoma cruzi]|uniref:Mucin TcMUCII, putative n=2 Tax=Trypanosoma cruzi TaxID=5693 RepID=Q4DU16_TRYCC|nr:mucin TcMUCII, putative [Trypanosoma cruzi]EAN96006.1 mucin TcMUCII, putative [Trypanosoma cruzi]PWV19838.1 putative mucin TcMUCII [Trypanosoma cruzi]RNC52927.1 mucin TcMUCII [Trypanosoma cruzi]|eukprot:XP_817857.1 mucin TcMUCII [Trypanosoma cruzi strain CL Brener]
MMMTCRLLCALLVLALCCCPYVCATEPLTAGDPAEATMTAGPNGKDTSSATGAPELTGQETVEQAQASVQTTTKNEDKANTNGAISPRLSPEAVVQEAVQSNLPILGSDEEPGITAVGGGGLTGPEQPKDKNGTTGGKNDTTVSLSSTKPSTEQSNQEAEDPSKTTTTTTTKAPSTTTTEAPTTTTTRAPSRLREIDGSLSSSAWVCAPLLLAASALAYTAVG